MGAEQDRLHANNRRSPRGIRDDRSGRVGDGPSPLRPRPGPTPPADGRERDVGRVPHRSGRTGVVVGQQPRTTVDVRPLISFTPPGSNPILGSLGPGHEARRAEPVQPSRPTDPVGRPDGGCPGRAGSGRNGRVQAGRVGLVIGRLAGSECHPTRSRSAHTHCPTIGPMGPGRGGPDGLAGDPDRWAWAGRRPTGGGRPFNPLLGRTAGSDPGRSGCPHTPAHLARSPRPTESRMIR